MLRTKEFLYIRNLDPDRWPNGVVDAKSTFLNRQLADTDASPTKTYLVEHRNDQNVKVFFDYAFAKRPAEELYVVATDPDQLRNVAGDSEYAAVKQRLWARLEAELRRTGDPRIVGGDELIDRYPYLGAKESHPIWERFVHPPR